MQEDLTPILLLVFGPSNENPKTQFKILFCGPLKSRKRMGVERLGQSYTLQNHFFMLYPVEMFHEGMPGPASDQDPSTCVSTYLGLQVYTIMPGPLFLMCVDFLIQ
jgi:hypothetical protein